MILKLVDFKNSVFSSAGQHEAKLASLANNIQNKIPVYYTL